MPFLLLSGFLILAALPLTESPTVIWVLAASQLALLAGEIKRGQVTGAGAFIFMSFLFFGVRPIYLVLENDKYLFTTVYRLRVGALEIGDSMWWASLALLCFALGAYCVPRVNRLWLSKRMRASTRALMSAPNRGGRCARS
ncbi:MAG: hypothetical protein ACKOD5_13880 [Chthoniobacterales bacterium]